MKLSLTESQCDIVWQAASPLPRADHSLFLERVAELLNAEPEIGDGTVYRAVREAQKVCWTPPDRIRSQ
jgi:hypothetical protein